MYPVSWTRPGGPRAPRPSPQRPARGRRRAAVRALAVCFTAAVPLQAVAQATCTAAPAVPDALLRPGSSWSALQGFMTENGIAFIAGDSALVIPCPARSSSRCLPMTARVAAEQRANCVTLAMVQQDSARFLGLVRRYGGWDPANLGFGQPNPTDSVYLLVKGGQSLGIYHDSGGRVRTIPQSPTSWKFRFHPEDSTFATARARWQPDSSSVRGLVAMREPHARGGPTALLPDDGDGFQMADPAYAWMTCAAGCCQFHGSGSGGMGDPGPQGPPHHPPHNPPGQHPGNRPRRE